MLGDVLKRNLNRLKYASAEKSECDSFWVILRDIAVEEIIEYGEPVDSDIIIPLYYHILSDNLDYVPIYFQEILPSNNQPRFRVIIRNLFSSNAFHKDGIANQKGIYAYREVNENKKGKRIIFQKR